MTFQEMINQVVHVFEDGVLRTGYIGGASWSPADNLTRYAVFFTDRGLEKVVGSINNVFLARVNGAVRNLIPDQDYKHYTKDQLEFLGEVRR